MSANARIVVYGIAALLALGGLVVLANDGGGLFLVGFGALLAASVALEGRYRSGHTRSDIPPERWVRTGEREIDTETGQPCEVWFDPVTGARRYEPLAGDPRR